MVDILIDAIANFGISSLASNIGTNLIVKSDKKILDKLAIGLGTFLVSSYVEDKVSEHIKKKVNDISEEVKEGLEKKEVEDGREVSE